MTFAKPSEDSTLEKCANASDMKLTKSMKEVIRMLNSGTLVQRSRINHAQRLAPLLHSTDALNRAWQTLSSNSKPEKKQVEEKTTGED